jgi:hypothetical protein
MTLIGEKGQGIREVIFYLAKAVPDLMRGEPRNCGLIVRVAESTELTYRFMDRPPLFIDPQAAADFGEKVGGYHETIANWKAAFEKHGTKSMHFVGKRSGNKYANPALYIEPAFNRMVAGRVNFGELYKRLVLPEGRTHA